MKKKYCFNALKIMAIFLIIMINHIAYAQPSITRGVKPVQCSVKDTELQGIYVGECDANGLAHGMGTAKSMTTMYTGEFFHGQKHGKGTQRWLDTNDQYTGQYSHDLREGVGIYIWGDTSPLKGHQYIGQFKQGARHGQGIFDWPNGERYAGAWENDEQTDYYTPTQILQSQTSIAKDWQPKNSN